VFQRLSFFSADVNNMEQRVEVTKRSPELVRFNKGDPKDPINYSRRKKMTVVADLCLLAFFS
jgi:hypothetical protein